MLHQLVKGIFVKFTCVHNIYATEILILFVFLPYILQFNQTLISESEFGPVSLLFSCIGCYKKGKNIE